MPGLLLSYLLPGRVLLRQQECSDNSGVFVTHIPDRLQSAGTKALRVFQPMENPGGGQQGSHLRQSWTDVSLILIRIDDVADWQAYFP